MPNYNLKTLAGVSALAFMLTACGGGGGGGIASIPPPPITPTPTPSPSPTPTPTPTPASTPTIIFPSVTTGTTFATLGYEAPAANVTPGSLTGNGFSVKYDASSKLYIFDAPSTAPGTLDVYQTGDRYWNATLTGQPAGSSASIDVFRPGPQNYDFALTYTSFGLYEASNGAIGAVAFGIPTSSSAVPVSGSGTYTAFVAAQDADNTGIRGSATLQFNFGAGTLSGHFDPVIYDYLAGDMLLSRYDFVNTVYGVGSTAFSGQLSSQDVAGLGSFDGQFTGPVAQELMARFSAPFTDPYTNKPSTMFGVWVGAK